MLQKRSNNDMQHFIISTNLMNQNKQEREIDNTNTQLELAKPQTIEETTNLTI